MVFKFLNLIYVLSSFIEPDAPEVTILDNLSTEKSCAFEWSAPKNVFGELRSYDIHIKFGAFEFYNPPSCANDFEDTTEDTIRDPNTRNYVFDKALPYASYLIQVKASNNEATSAYSSLRECKTLPGGLLEILLNFKTCNSIFLLSAPPSPVRDLKMLERRQNLTDAYNKTTVISWSLPCRSNAIITKFIIECDNLSYLHSNITFVVPVAGEQDEYSLSTDDLLPDSQYNISIKAITETGVEGEESTKIFEIEAGCEFRDVEDFFSPKLTFFCALCISARLIKCGHSADIHRAIHKVGEAYDSEFYF